MTISHSRFLKSGAIKAKLNNQTIEIFHQKPIARTPNAWAQAEAAFARSAKCIQYGICEWVSHAADRIGAAVVKLPDGFKGVTTELMDDELEVVGTLLKNEKGKLYVETDLEVVEKLRRAREKAKMDANTMSVGDFGHDSTAYLASLEAKDTSTGLFTRGHGLQP